MFKKKQKNYKKNYGFMKPYYKKEMKMFKKKLESCGEKKMKQITTFNIPITLADSAGGLNSNYGLIKSASPLEGSQQSQRVGNKIFVRYIRAELAILGTTENYNTGHIGILFAKERKAQGCGTVSIAQLFPDVGPIPNPITTFKEGFDKFEVTMKPIQSINAVALGIVESNVPYQYLITKTIKVMKSCTFDRANNINIPDYFIRAFSFVGFTGTVGNGHTQTLKTTITYTDI